MVKKKKKGKPNQRNKGGIKRSDAGGNREKKEMEKAKQERHCNQLVSSFKQDPFDDNQLAYQLEALGGLCVKEVE